MYPSYYDPCIFSKNFNDFWLLFLTINKYFVINVGPPTCNDSCILSKSFNAFWLLFLTIYKYFVINVGPPTCKCGIITHAYLRTINFWKVFITINKYFIINVGAPTFKFPKTQEEIKYKLYPVNKLNLGIINYMFLKRENMYLSFTPYFIYISMSPTLGMKFDIATEKF